MNKNIVYEENNLLIILDLGANDGCSILKFKKILQDKKINNYLIYSFEPNIFFQKNLENLAKADKNVVFLNKVAGTENSKIKLYLSQGGNDGSSIYSDKITNKISKNVYDVCEQIDIVDFINNLAPHNKLWIKMDIEGSEYNLIPHMHKNNILEKVDKLFIEWHYKKIPSITKEMHEKSVSLVKHIDTSYWDAFSYRDKNITKDDYKQFLDNIRTSNK